MTGLALALYGVYLGLGFGWRSWSQWRRTGDTGFRGVSGRPGSAEWWAGVLFAAAVVAGALGPVVALAGVEPLSFVDAAAIQWAGLSAAAAGIVIILVAQVHMGTSWRIGVEESESTELVTSGLFGVVRNPFFSGTVLAGAGMAMMVPNAVSLLGLLTVIVAVELQVRVVEEPYLVRVQGDDYLDYAARTGRFAPLVGSRTRSSVPSSP